jgi:dolichyl-phosphate-mannose-protein mannosyltransferase
MNKRIKYISIGLFFSSLLLLGLSRFRDYGISWDEPQQRLTGAVTVNYIAKVLHIHGVGANKNFPTLATYPDREYGVAFEAPAFALENIFKLRDSRDIYMFRHFLTFLVFLGGVCAVYKLSYRRFSDWRIGLLSALFLVLTPRLFADGFYNSKDTVFMAVFAAAMNTAISFVLQPRVKTALIHALATAVAIDVRIMAILLVAVSVSLLLVRILRRELQPSRACLVLGVYVIVAFILVILMWPYLWSHPLLHFWEAFRLMSRYQGGGQVRYMGTFIPNTEIPWHYSFVWISITTPLLYLTLFLVGTYSICGQILVRRIRLWENDRELQDIVFLALFFAPIIAVILFHSVLYDGWRHLYFVYPAFLLVSTKGWVALWSIRSTSKIYKAILVSLTVISLLLTATWMCKAHPLENVYFNILAGQNVRARYDLDYWGLANRAALEHIVKVDHSAVVNVWAESTTPLWISVLMLKRGDRSRVRIDDVRRAPYYVFNNYRGVRDADTAKDSRDYELFYEVRVGEEVVLSVFKWKGPPATENSCVR